MSHFAGLFLAAGVQLPTDLPLPVMWDWAVVLSLRPLPLLLSVLTCVIYWDTK